MLHVLCVERALRLSSCYIFFCTNDGKVTACGNGKDGLKQLMNNKIDIAMVDFLMVRRSIYC